MAPRERVSGSIVVENRLPELERVPIYLREWREFRGLTQQGVEQLNNWPRARVSNLELGRALITDHVLGALARAYGCEVPDLFRPPPPLDPQDAEADAVRVALIEAKQSLGGATGFAVLHDALRAIEALMAEVQAIRAAILPRLDALDRGVSDAGKRIRQAVKTADNLADSFERAATNLRAASHREPEPESEKTVSEQ